ncbi:MAG: putative ABC exporter domain-containing protein, partial [Spirochaetales bacterium]|nr:putative ABC exporter domain-containing protein [Spirochaetales bacterium]
MNSLVYLVTRSVKNSFLELPRKPGKLALYILALAFILGNLWLSNFTPPEGFSDIIWLKGILFLLVLFFALTTLQKGLSTGDTIFVMSDVNLLFVSPLSPRTVLIYGVARMAKTALYVGFFILLQGGLLGITFGLGFGALTLVLLGFVLAVPPLLMLSLVIYGFTNGRSGPKRAVRLTVLAVFLPLAAYGLIPFVQTGDIWTAAERALGSPFFSWVPVAGWASEGAIRLIRGDTGSGLLFLSLLPLAGGLLFAVIARSNPDYYEDVLAAAETAFEKKRAAAGGRLGTGAGSPKRARVFKAGMGGSGAAALFHKHLRESFRANRLGLWGLPSALLGALAVIFALMIRDNEAGILLILYTLMWAQIFIIGTGQGIRELYFPYIYLVPAPSFSKILWSNLAFVLKILVESVFMFGAAALILGEDPRVTALVILAFVLFSLLLIGINYLSLRWTGAGLSAGFLVLIYVIAAAVIMLPGLIPAAIVGYVLTGSRGIFAGLGVLSIWELSAALVCFF